MPDSAAAKRACDACHRRKVKCISNTVDVCKNCHQAGLQCTYNAVPQKKGPKGCRAKVISELRETQRQSYITARERARNEVAKVSASLLSPPPAPAWCARPLPPQLIETCVEYFFTNIYPTQPILHRDRLHQTIASMHESAESFCLIASLCAYMLIQPNLQLPASIAAKADAEVAYSFNMGKDLLAETLEVRKTCNYVENPTLASVTTSFFLFGCHFCLEKHNTAWFHLREATTLALFLGMHQEDLYNGRDGVEDMLRRRLFWLLFVTERAYALQAQKPLTLHATISLPDLSDDPHDAITLTGFMHLIVLFKPFDDTFVGLWNQSINGCTTEWVINLQKQLSDALPLYLESTETQAVDLRTSQKWLRIMVWQLSISHRLLSSTAHDESMTFQYPIELSRELLTEVGQFSQESMEAHGIGLVKKIFDVACTLVDVMACVPLEQHAFEVGPQDYLNHYLHLMSKLRGGTRYFPLLLAKAHDALPRFTEPMILQALPSSYEGQFESMSEESGEQSPADLDSGLASPFAPPTYKTEFSNEVDDPAYGVTFPSMHEPLSPISNSYSPDSALAA